MSIKCHCGRPLHYTDPAARAAVELMIILSGGQRYSRVHTPDGVFLVDKHYIALHGIKGRDLAKLGFVKEPA